MQIDDTKAEKSFGTIVILQAKNSVSQVTHQSLTDMSLRKRILTIK